MLTQDPLGTYSSGIAGSILDLILFIFLFEWVFYLQVCQGITCVPLSSPY